MTCSKILFAVSISLVSVSALATPDSDEGGWWGWNFAQALGISINEFKTEMQYIGRIAKYVDVQVSGNYPLYQLKLKETDIIVGRIRYDEMNGEVTVYTFFPYRIPKDRIKTVGEFLQKLNENKSVKEDAYGHYYVNPNSGECGFIRRLTSIQQLRGNPPPSLPASQELLEHWNDRHIYELHPEIKALASSTSFTVADCLNTIKLLPLDKRTSQKLTELKLGYDTKRSK